MRDNTQQENYVEISRRLNTITTVGAGIISVLMTLACWGAWRNLVIVGAIQLALVPFNAFATMVLLRRWGARPTETLRTAVNMGATLISCHYAGWPFPMWLWLPFVALAFDQADPRISWGMVVVLSIGVDLSALSAGRPSIELASFTFLAIFCMTISTAKHHIVRDMLLKSDRQRKELEHAQAETERQIHARELIEVELRHSQKLEAIGRLAASIAHEINTPVQFVNDSLNFVQGAGTDLLALIERYRSEHPTTPERTAAEAEFDLEYIADNLPKACERSMEGLARIASIVRSMKAFAHPDQTVMAPAEINGAIESTLTIARGEYKQVADIVTELGELPLVTCHVGEVNQVLLNLLVNAAHAIEDVVGPSGGRGRITIRTRAENDQVLISVSDTGAGIPAAIRDRVFEPFFTTKAVGRGTGQGLAIARSVIAKHGGTLTFESTPGTGTTFRILLPVEPAKLRAA